MLTTVPNFRDLGGMATADGRRLRAGAVLRSAMPMTGDGPPMAIDWPPAVVLDLTSPTESDVTHPLHALGSQVFRLPMFAALEPGIAPPQDRPGLYRMMLDHAHQGLVDVVHTVSGHQGSHLIHCAAGKDRTGVAVALILRLLGVPRQHVVDDYLLSKAHTAAISERLALLPGHELRQELPPAFFTVSAEAIESVLDYWDGNGGVDQWFISAGAQAGTVEKLRSNLLTD